MLTSSPQNSAYDNFLRAASFWWRAAYIYFAYKTTQARHLVFWAVHIGRGPLMCVAQQGCCPTRAPMLYVLAVCVLEST